MSEVYNFKPLSEVELLEEPGEGTTVLSVESGAVKQIPAAKLGGGGAGSFIVSGVLDADTATVTGADKTFAEIMAAIDAGAFPVLRLDMTAFELGYIYGTISMVMPGQGVVFTSFADGGLLMVICTPDDQWMIQGMGE